MQVYLFDEDPTGKKIILNNFQLKINHQGTKNYKIEFKVHDPILENKIEIITSSKQTILDGPSKKIMIFFKFDPVILENGTRKIIMDISDTNAVISSTEVVLVGPN